jgi:hypothetical protein
LSKTINPEAMLILNETKLIEIFILCDDLMKAIDQHMASQSLEEPEGSGREYPRKMSDSERLAIVIFYHLSGVKCFKWYYNHIICGALSDCFPQAWSYSTFVEKKGELNLYLYLLMVMQQRAHLDTEAYYVDSTPLVVCHNKRIKRHKVFSRLARRGKTSVGWFYGFKLHLIINQLGQIVFTRLTQGNVTDNNQIILQEMADAINGFIYADKGYITAMLDQLKEKGFHLISKVRNNMKPKPMTAHQKYYLRKRGLIECVIHFLKFICNIEHSRHRSPVNFMVNLLAGLCAYQFIEPKPSIPNSKNFLPMTQIMKI